MYLETAWADRKRRLAPVSMQLGNQSYLVSARVFAAFVVARLAWHATLPTIAQMPGHPFLRGWFRCWN